MKRRWMGLLAAFLLAVSPVLLAGANAESALLFKLRKQIDAGSGLKGNVAVTGLDGLEGMNLDVKYIRQKEQGQLALSLLSGGEELLKAALYSQENGLAIDAGLSSGKLYSFSGGWESLLGSLLEGDEAQTSTPPLYTALHGILFPEDEKLAARLSEAATPYLIKVDLWMQGFAGSPVLTKDQAGVTVMEVTYSIPASALKAEMKQLLMDLLADKTLLPLLWEQVSQEQANLFLNPALQAFYFQAVDALPLEGEITMQRRVSTAGQLLETSISLPLTGFGNGLKRLSFASKSLVSGDLLDIALETEEGTLQFTGQKTAASQPDTTAYSGMLRYLPVEIPNWQVDATAPQYASKALSVSYQAAYTANLYTDADGKNKESYTLLVNLNPDWSHLTEDVTEEIKAQFVLTEPLQITASAQLASGQARNASTSLETQVRFASGRADWQLTGQFKTTPPWAFTPVDMAAAEKLENLTQDQINALLTEILAKPGLLPVLMYLVPQNQDIPGTVG